MPNKFMAAAGRGLTSESGWVYDPPWFWNITRRSKARAFANRSAAQTAVAMRGANQRLAVCCTGVIDGGRGGVINDIAV